MEFVYYKHTDFITTLFNKIESKMNLFEFCGNVKKCKTKNYHIKIRCTFLATNSLTGAYNFSFMHVRFVGIMF